MSPRFAAVLALAALLALAATLVDVAFRADGSGVNRDRKGDSLRTPALSRCEVA